MRLRPLLGLLLCLAVLPAQARTHLDRDELKVLATSSVAVVYVDTGTALEHQLDPQHHMLGVTPLTAVLADVLNSYRLHMLLLHIAPYQVALDSLALPQATHRGVQDALASVPWLGKTPWTHVRQDLKDPLFLTRQAEQAKAPVVIFIQPRLFLDPAVDTLYLVCYIDIETAGPQGIGISHYDSSEVIAAQQVGDAGMSAAEADPAQPPDAPDLRMARLLANDGQVFKQVYAKLMAQSQQQLYYYFTGTQSPPSSALSRLGD